MIYPTVLEAIGNTPIVKLNRVIHDLDDDIRDVDVYAKLEFLNPGGSIKDRIGLWLIEDAEKKGILKPGGTVVEGTSGNTGFGLAIASAIKGYKCVFVLPDKMSQEKILSLRAFGARVVVTPTAVEPEDPRSYYSVSKRLAAETNGFYVNQYNNLANRDCHLKTTGPEIHKQMPDVDVIIAGIGTGGTISGIGRYFKDVKPDTRIVAVDPVGSIVYDKFKFQKDVEAKPYKIEGIGEDFFPENYDFDVIDDMVQVEDKESFLMTRCLLVQEGIYSGVSSGSAVVGAIRWINQNKKDLHGKKVLVILPDSGNRYLSKVYDDEWMREAGFLDMPSLGTVKDLLMTLNMKPGKVIMADQSETVGSLIERMKEANISQIPVRDEDGWIKGIATEEGVLKSIYEGAANSNDLIGNVMERVVNPSVEFVRPQDSIERVSSLITSGKVPLIAEESKENSIIGIITKIDLLTYMGHRQK